VENTTISIESIVPSGDLNARGIKKIKRDKHKEKWKYTSVKFRLDHPRADLLKGKQFAFRLQNLDRGTSVEFNEDSANPNNLVEFTYLFNNEFEKYHYNHQKKDGENFEIQFVLIDGDDLHFLYNGRFSVYDDGKWIQP
ncbi:MAG: hypothetical protein AAF985_25315, partial [Bacteroidota bacterium]